MTGLGTIPGAGHVVGVLLAAGRGRRMGGSKQLIIVETADGPKPLIAAAYDAIRPACRELMVVLGHRAEEVAAALAPRPFHRVHADPDAPMLDSLVAAIHAIAGLDYPAAMLLHPADHPAVQRQTLREILAAHHDDLGLAIIPTHQSRGGHPTLIPPRLFGPILAFAAAGGEGGLRAFWHLHPDECRHVQVNDPSITRDLDTPADLHA